MAGIYIHIPFCRKACHYCDFHFSTNLSKQPEMVEAICEEINRRADYLNEEVRTIYFGGGTPSLLNEEELERILNTLDQNFDISPASEITLEANPEDLTTSKTESLKDLGINRLSIGVQTFSEEGLKWMNRNHNRDQIATAYENARGSDFRNISLDLIYAVPVHEKDTWEKDLATTIELKPEHISIYGLTIEENTVFGKWKSSGRLDEVAEDQAALQYQACVATLAGAGYRQYEVSNFAIAEHESKHNSSYWAGEPYLGVGPGAHSYNGRSRQFNHRNNHGYIKAVSNGTSHFEIEQLSRIQLMNETILTRLRTARGIDLDAFKKAFGVDLQAKNSLDIMKLKDRGMLAISGDNLSLTTDGFLVADEIALKLFFDE